MQPDDDEAQELEGPDPRAWPGIPAIWDRVRDIEVIDQVLGALSGKTARETDDPACLEARRFLAAAAAQQCEELSRVLLSMYQVRLGEGAGALPFEGAGRPRAFGADPSPPAGTLPASLP